MFRTRLERAHPIRGARPRVQFVRRSLTILTTLLLTSFGLAPESGLAQCPDPLAWTLTGSVQDAQGLPLAGFDIDILDGGGNPLDLSQDFTDAAGNFTLYICTPIANGVYPVFVSPPTGAPYFPNSVSVFIGGDSVVPAPIVLESGVLVTGSVVDDQGLPIEAIDLDFIDPTTGAPVPFSGDDTLTDGSFSVLVMPDLYDVKFQETIATVPVGPYVPVLLTGRPLTSSTDLGTIVMRDGITLTGTVQNASGTPLLGADIDVADLITGDEVYLPGVSDQTDAGGNFSALVPAGTWEVVVDPPAGTSLVSQLIVLDIVAPGPVSLGTISLPDGVEVSGTTRDPGAQPVPSVDLDFIISSSGIEIPTADDNANTSGIFSVRVVPDTYDIQFKPSFSTGLAPIELSAVIVSAPTPLGDVTLPIGNALTGVITQSGVPVENARVTLAVGGSPVVVFGNRTDVTGAYALRQVPGIYDVTITPPGGGSPVTIAGVDLSTDQTLDLDLAGATPPPSVSGLSCTVDNSDVTLAWTNGALDYTTIEILRDGIAILSIPGASTDTTDLGLADGLYEYSIVPIRDGLFALAAECTVIVDNTPGSVFLRGDSNGDASVNIADAIGTLDQLFGGATPSTCPDAQDANDDGSVNIADAIYTLGFLFSGGPPPPLPYPAEGPDPTADGIDCI